MAAVSVVIPVHNGAAYVADAIESVLAQTRPPAECLVIDDGSTDRTSDVVAGFARDITYVRVAWGGVSRARNHGSGLARADLIAFLDHDDAWYPEKLERQVDALAGRPDAPMALCAAEVVDADGLSLGIRRLRTRRGLVAGMLTFDGTEIPSCSSTGLFQRKWLISCGGFDPALSVSADWDLLLRAVLDGGLAYVDEPLVRYRLHASNMSRNIGTMERDMELAFAKAFADDRLPDGVRAKRRRAYGRLYRMLAGSYRDVGDQRGAARMLMKAVAQDPKVALELVTRPPRGGASS